MNVTGGKEMCLPGNGRKPISWRQRGRRRGACFYPGGNAPGAGRERAGPADLKMRSHKAEAVLRNYLDMRDLRLTGQRKIILDAFLRAGCHLTIEELYGKAREIYPNVGMATVYRTVKLLCECGLVSGFKHADGACRYELGNEFHEHLICVKCGRLVEVTDPEIQELQNRTARMNAFKILHSRLELYGLCRECL